jgi:hypothetical protein
MAKRSLRERVFGSARGLDRSLLPFMGPAQVGAGHPEEPYHLPVDARCPICGGPMNLHTVARSSNPSVPTKIICPPPESWQGA